MRLLLPTSERRKDTHEDVLHAQYLVGLLPPSEQLDKPYFRGDIYEEASAPRAKVWESETYGKTEVSSQPTLTSLQSRNLYREA